MKTEIIAVGTELLLGQIVNSNAQFISSKLANIGYDVFYHTAVGDNEEKLLGILHNAMERSKLIILTGGLGPTQDDLTKETVSKFLGVNLILHEDSYQNIIEYFNKRNLLMTPNNQKQAMILEDSIIFPNLNGLAPGMAISKKEHYFVLLPGPPREMEPMFQNFVLPWLIKISKNSYVIYSKTLRFFDIGESTLETKIIDLIENQKNPSIAPLAQDGEVTLRLTAKADNTANAIKMIEPLENEILRRLADFFYGFNNDSIESLVIDKLKKLNKTLSIAESCTGGGISSKITSVEGSSSIFKGSIIAYNNDVKTNLLGVNNKVLNENGAISDVTAKIMANEIRKLLHSDYGLSITGICGETSLEGKPIGLIYIGISNSIGENKVFKINLAGNRSFMQIRAIKYALFYLLKNI